MPGTNENASSGSFHMEVEQREGAAVVRLAGSIHMNVCEHLQSELLRLVDRPSHRVILDLSRLTFICSLGLGAMVAAHLRSRHHQGAVRVVSPDHSIRTLLEITKLVKLFPPYDSVDAAIAEG